MAEVKQAPVQQKKPTNGMAVASLVLSIAGMVALPIIGPLMGVIFGTVAKNQIKTTHEEGSGLATAGIIIGIIQLVLALLLFIFIAVLILAGAFSDNYSAY